jgi:hypothetical protein
VNACDVFASALFVRPLVLVSLIADIPPVNVRHTIIGINPTTSLPHILQVLIFSQMVKMIDFIDEFCEFRKYPCERLDGRIAGNERQKSIDRCVHLYLWFVVFSVCVCAYHLLQVQYCIFSVEYSVNCSRFFCAACCVAKKL